MKTPKTIEALIQRSRQEGRSSSTQFFRIDLEKAQIKMQSFSLASSSYYILEFIQVAVAKGANFVDIVIDKDMSRIAWHGGFFTKSDLQGLFDALTSASSPLRDLALGVNALLNFDPLIRIESGGGTLENSVCLDIKHSKKEQSLGDYILIFSDPITPVDGTYILASEMKEVAMVWDPSGRKKREELSLISKHCLTLEIPVIVNEYYAYMSRTPRVFETLKTTSFDFGDLYGSIGTTGGDSIFRLTRHGIWIKDVEYDLGLGVNFKGTVGFDRLTQTADRTSIARDAIWKEMWRRLKFVAMELIGRDPSSVAIIDKEGDFVEFEDLLKETLDGIILFDSTPSNETLKLYKSRYPYPHYVVSDPELVQSLFSSIEVVLATDKFVSLLPVEKNTEDKNSFFLPRKSIDFLPFGFILSVEIYTPKHKNITTLNWRKQGKFISEIRSEDLPLGFSIVVNMDPESVMPANFKELSLEGLLGRLDILQAVSIEIIESYIELVTPRSKLGNHYLQVMASTLIFSIDEGIFSVRRLGLGNRNIADTKILYTIAGTAVSINEIVQQISSQHGVFFGCLDPSKMDFRDVDRTQVLYLNEFEEKHLLLLFGHSYIRLDGDNFVFYNKHKEGEEFTIPKDPEGSDFSLETDVSLFSFDSVKPSMREFYRRFLIWKVCKNANSEKSSALKKIPLFRGINEDWFSFANLEDTLEMLDGWPKRTQIPDGLKQHQSTTSILAMDPFVFFALAGSKKINAVANEKQGPRADLRESVLRLELCTSDPQNPNIDNEPKSYSGVFALMPRNTQNTYTLLRSEQAWVTEAIANQYYCSAEVKYQGGKRGPINHVDMDVFIQHCIRLYEKAAALIPVSDNVKAHSYAEPALFGALNFVSIKKYGGGFQLVFASQDLRSLFSCKIFRAKTGLPLSALSLVEGFRAPLGELAEDAPHYQREWLEKILILKQTTLPKVEAPTLKNPLAWLVHFCESGLERIIFCVQRSPHDPLLTLEDRNYYLNLTHPMMKLDQNRKLVLVAIHVVETMYSNGSIQSFARRRAYTRLLDLLAPMDE